MKQNDFGLLILPIEEVDISFVYGYNVYILISMQCRGSGVNA